MSLAWADCMVVLNILWRFGASFYCLDFHRCLFSCSLNIPDRWNQQSRSYSLFDSSKFPETFERVRGGKGSNEFPQSGQFLLLFAKEHQLYPSDFPGFHNHFSFDWGTCFLNRSGVFLWWAWQTIDKIRLGSLKGVFLFVIVGYIPFRTQWMKKKRKKI